MLGSLSGGDQAGIHGGLVEVLLHDRLAFFDDPRDPVAVLAARLLVQAFEHALEAIDMSACLLEVRLEG